MSVKKLNIGIVGVVAALLTAVLFPTPAQAAVASDRGTRARATAPPAPAGAQSASAATRTSAATVASPTISPTTTVGYVAPGGGYTCNTGYLCTLAWDPNTTLGGSGVTGAWKIFYLFNCHTYAVINWFGNGAYLNNQTPAGIHGVRSYFLVQAGGIDLSFTPDGQQWGYDWDPIWYIKNC